MPLPSNRSSPATRPARAKAPPFDRVLEEHGPAVLRFCAAQVGAQRADDCFQETMLSALRAYGKLRDPHAVKTWLFSIAARKAIDTQRANARTADPTEETDEHAAAPEQRPAVEQEELWERVRALPDKQRQAVTLRYRGDLTNREVAQIMQITEAAARRNVFEGLKRLREDT